MKNVIKSGFTLVELLVVVLIIGILSSVALPQYTKAVKKAKGVKITTAASALVKALNMAYLEDGAYVRDYSAYSFGNVQGDDFDIEVPVINWDRGSELLVYSDGSSARTASSTSVDIVLQGAGNDNFHLRYHLSQGKLNYVTCEGGGCKSYFPGTLLSSN